MLFSDSPLELFDTDNSFKRILCLTVCHGKYTISRICALSYDREHFSNTDLHVSDLRIVGTRNILVYRMCQFDKQFESTNRANHMIW